MKKLVRRIKLGIPSLLDDGRGYSVDGIDTHNCCVHPDTMIDVELLEDVVEIDGKFFRVVKAGES